MAGTGIWIPPKLGKWAYWGWLKDVEKVESVPVPFSPTVPAVSVEDSSGKVRIVSSGGNVNVRRGNGLNYSRITSVIPGTLLEYVATAANGWHAVKVGKQVGWVSGEFAELTTA